MGREKETSESKQESTPRSRFLDGEEDGLKLGGYGCTIRVTAHSEADGEGKVVVRVYRRTPYTQETSCPNTREVRLAAVEAAEALLEATPAGPSPSDLAAEPPAAPLTITDAFVHYLREEADMPATSLEWGEKKVLEHLRSRPPEARVQMPGPDYLISVLQTYRRIRRVGAIPLNTELSNLEGFQLRRHVTRSTTREWGRRKRPMSPETVRTDFGRLRTVIYYLQDNFKKRWGQRSNPVRKLPPIRGKPKRPEVGEERAARIIAELARRPKLWRAYAAAIIALTLGGRIGAIGANQRGKQDLRPSLTFADFIDEGGRLRLRWRHAILKAHEEDVMAPYVARLEALVRWLQAEYPNPLGPEHPLLWSPKNPRVSVTYTALTSNLTEVWPVACGKPRPYGLAWPTRTTSGPGSTPATRRTVARLPHTARRRPGGDVGGRLGAVAVREGGDPRPDEPVPGGMFPFSRHGRPGERVAGSGGPTGVYAGRDNKRRGRSPWIPSPTGGVEERSATGARESADKPLSAFSWKAALASTPRGYLSSERYS